MIDYNTNNIISVRELSVQVKDYLSSLDIEVLIDYSTLSITSLIVPEDRSVLNRAIEGLEGVIQAVLDSVDTYTHPKVTGLLQLLDEYLVVLETSKEYDYFYERRH